MKIPYSLRDCTQTALPSPAASGSGKSGGMSSKFMEKLGALSGGKLSEIWNSSGGASCSMGGIDIGSCSWRGGKQSSVVASLSVWC